MTPSTNHALFDAAFQHLPLIAILRGIAPTQAVAVAQTLWDAGWRIVEVPLNSPDALQSIACLRKQFDGRMVVGAGTVLSLTDAEGVFNAGGQLVLSPNFNPRVVQTTLQRGMVSIPGVQTASECFAALDAGAHALKLFPGDVIPPAGVKALRAVLPAATRLIVVGGVSETNLLEYADSGCNGFGIGSHLYRPHKTLQAIHDAALRMSLAHQSKNQGIH